MSSIKTASEKSGIQLLGLDPDKSPGLFRTVKLLPAGEVVVNFTGVPEELRKNNAFINVNYLLGSGFEPYTQFGIEAGLDGEKSLGKVVAGKCVLFATLPEECDYLAINNYHVSTRPKVIAEKVNRVSIPIKRATRFKVRIVDAKTGQPMPGIHTSLSYQTEDSWAMWTFASNSEGIVEGKALPGFARFMVNPDFEHLSKDLEIEFPNTETFELEDIRLEIDPDN